jgi:hypothetical protein
VIAVVAVGVLATIGFGVALLLKNTKNNDESIIHINASSRPAVGTQQPPSRAPPDRKTLQTGQPSVDEKSLFQTEF